MTFYEHQQTLSNCGHGWGMAVCASLGRLVTSDGSKNTLTIFEICLNGTFALLFTIGSKGDGPLQFAFMCEGYASGWMCFTVGTDCPTLLVAEAGNSRVQAVDVLARAHVGFPVVIDNPRGVAASAFLLAVSAWKKWNQGDHLVHVFDAQTRAVLYVIGHGRGAGDGQLDRPRGLRLSTDGTAIAVADCGNCRVSTFRTSDGAFAGHLLNVVENPYDVEECEGGWMVACWGSDTVAFVGRDGAASIGGSGSEDEKLYDPTAVALVFGVGLLVRQLGGRVQVFSTPDSRRWRDMSRVKVAWLGCVLRAGQRP